MKRRLLDQGLPRGTARLLVHSGWDVIHVSDLGMSSSADAEVLERAQAEARTCVTLDADFHSLLAISGKASPSVIRIRKQGLDAVALAALLQGIWADLEEALRDGAMVTVTERSVRIRRLPVVRP